MLRIWGRTSSINVQKVMWAVGELGRAHERIDAGGAFGGLDSDEYGLRNPNRRVPTIDDDGVAMWESNACVRYLAARYDAGGLWPEDPAARARADMWMDWQQTTLAADGGIDLWRQWSFRYDGPAGLHSAQVRATDLDGATQPEERTKVFPDGARGWHQIQFRVD